MGARRLELGRSLGGGRRPGGSARLEAWIGSKGAYPAVGPAETKEAGSGFDYGDCPWCAVGLLINEPHLQHQDELGGFLNPHLQGG